MNRRIWIKQIAIVGTTTLLLPSCLQNKSSFIYQNFNLTFEEQTVLENLVNVIIPTTNTLGAQELKLSTFVIKMIDDCYSPDDQKKLLTGLRQLDSYSKKNNSKNFSDLNTEEKIKLLKNAIETLSKENNLTYFISETRKLTIMGFQNSEYVMTKLTPYELVPGHFYGCVRLNKKA